MVVTIRGKPQPAQQAATSDRPQALALNVDFHVAILEAAEIDLPNGSLLPVTASIGGALFGEVQGDSREQLMERADRRLYESKRNGRNRVTVTD